MPSALPSSEKNVRSKYNAVKVQVDGITFASKAESVRYQELKFLERAGHIHKLELQPKFELAPSVKFKGATRATPALRYLADFKYIDHLGETIVEDVKGHITDSYRIKKHLMLAILGIEIVEVKKRKSSRK
ncbi:DUF1064 domain-containing protein [Polynucleobacter sp. UK-Kesae-W10]|uniref:DUF1064 domain-containing protein n=1 Tax=Polynucleobacter sp. UK-Kesae-W10 TaxID=1819738 RepID=UPI001C0D4552|nr:DUF1064 domain-containing protein [Polynucleobacter sp. UK-Kesae-W10]MBU3577524.1 DUF1064 domain-containing protein [Polynucleobacter sp. UK-Kesae-W10]